jgi:tyrosine-protein phosphatase SIW14
MVSMRTVLGALILTACAFGQGQVRHFIRIDDHISRGRQPNKAGFEELKHEGFKTVLDLRGGPIHEPHERKVVEGLGMQYISIRLSGIWEPKDDQIARILSVMEDPARWPIFMHCRRGDDRLGLAIACYRISHDHWTNQQAFEEAIHNGMSRFEPLMRRYIRHFDPSKITVNTASVGNGQ